MTAPSALLHQGRPTWWVYPVLALGCILALAPLAILVSTAFKTDAQTFSSTVWELPSPATLENLAATLDHNVLGTLRVTVIVSALMTLAQLVFSTLAGYAFARLRFPGRDVVFWAYLATLMIPNVVTIIPLFILVQRLGVSDSMFALVLPYILGTPFGVFLMRQYFFTLPQDLEAAASIDGAGHIRTFVSIIFPLSRPMVATLALITFVQGWNNYLWPLIASSSESTRVITVTIASLSSNYGIPIGLMMAFSLVATVPPLLMFMLFQRQLIQSIALSGFK